MQPEPRPLKRHQNLIPLSREHHQVLILAQLLKRDVPNYEGLPDRPEGKIEYTLSFFEQSILPHFEKEEKELLPKIRGYSRELDKQCDIVLHEHQAIRRSMERLKNDPETDPTAQLDALGRLLEGHVRREERVLFMKAQGVVPEAVIGKLSLG